MLKLQSRDLPDVVLRRNLPAYLSGKDTAYIKFNARAGGQVNPAYMAGIEKLVKYERVKGRDLQAMIDGGEATSDEIVAAQWENSKATGLFRFGFFYDACVLSWETDILNGDAPMACDREHFMELCQAKGIPEIATAITELEVMCIKAGKAQHAHDEEEVKN